jgi:hypothetical protein
VAVELADLEDLVADGCWEGGCRKKKSLASRIGAEIYLPKTGEHESTHSRYTIYRIRAEQGRRRGQSLH